MKRFISVILTLFVCFSVIYAEDDDDGFEGFPEVYEYDSNGAGDQFLKLHLGALFPTFPVDFNKQLYTGGEATIGYYRFVKKSLAVGGEFSASYNLSIGKKTFVMLPITFGIMYQPVYEKFEFPIYVLLGMAYETWQNMDYAPGLIGKVSAGGYYRINDSCSVGLSTDCFIVPQWFIKDPKKNFTGFFQSAAIGVRYHF